MPENLTPNPWDNYIPSSSEKKQAVLMYMFVGLLLSLQQQDVSPYMHHHIKQSMGRIILLVLVIALDVILLVLSMFGKFFAILGGIITIPVLVLGIVCVKQAYDGKYQRDSNGAMRFFSFFSGLGSWVLNLFDADHYQSKIDLPTTWTESGLANSQEITTNNQNSDLNLSQYEINASVQQPTPPTT